MNSNNQKTEIMSLISEKDFKHLAEFENELCISIFIPTKRGGKEVLEGENQLSLKSRWQEVKKKLEKTDTSPEQIAKLEGPVSKLINNKDFWRHQSDGLAIFVSEDFFQYFTVPVNFEPYTFISKEFYLKPLTPMFSGDDEFYILALQIDKVELYEGTKYSIGRIDVEDLTPERLEERVGYDYEEKNRKHQTLHNMGGTSTQHGYDEANRDRKNEFLRFFRAVDKGLHKILKNEKVPLVVACQDYLFPIYQEASTYKFLYKESIPGNPSDYPNMFALHGAAVNLLEPYFEKDRDNKMTQFKELNPERTSVQVTDILPAVYEGKVDTLFLENREEIWGRYDEEMRKVVIEDQQHTQNTSLMNLAAKKTIQEGGSVYLVEEAFMPDKSSKMNAVFRYS